MVLTALLAALLLTACTSKSGPERGDLPALAANSVKEVETPVGFAPTRYPGDMTGGAYQDGRGYLLGPHFALRLTWRATGAALTDNGLLQLGPALGLDAARAEDGQEVLVAAADAEFRGGDFTPADGDPPPAAELVVDGRATALELLPLAADNSVVPIPGRGALFVASVRKGAHVTIRVTDAGRTQTLDVRTGARGRDAIDAYYRPNSQEMSAMTTAPAGIATPVGLFPVAVTYAFPPSLGKTNHPRAVRTPFLPSSGWAKDGRAWLAVPRPDATTPIVAGAALYTMTVDHPAVFALRLPDGTTRPALPGSSTMYLSVDGLGPNTSLSSVLFDVPADFTDGTFVTDLGAGVITAGAGDEEWAGRWSPAPAPFEVPVALR